jgi:hypothetical protein
MRRIRAQRPTRKREHPWSEALAADPRDPDILPAAPTTTYELAIRTTEDVLVMNGDLGAIAPSPEELSGAELAARAGVGDEEINGWSPTAFWSHVRGAELPSGPSTS